MPTVTIQMTGMECFKCGVAFAMPSSFDQKCTEDGTTFYCPHGHACYYGKTRLQSLQSEKEALERQLATERSNKQWWRTRQENTERSLRATRGVVTRTKNRISKGMCPCCQQRFTNLGRHMRNQHPDYAPAPSEGT